MFRERCFLPQWKPRLVVATSFESNDNLRGGCCSSARNWYWYRGIGGDHCISLVIARLPSWWRAAARAAVAPSKRNDVGEAFSPRCDVAQQRPDADVAWRHEPGRVRCGKTLSWRRALTLPSPHRRYHHHPPTSPHSPMPRIENDKNIIRTTSKNDLFASDVWIEMGEQIKF